MRIAVASGKGGTGKTTVSTNLARVLSGRGRVQYVDCDVEEPNGHLFLKPDVHSSEVVTVLVPEVDPQKCDQCGACSDICRFRAIACMGKVTITFPELCHGCGGCALVCPSRAIEEVPRAIGIVETGTAKGMKFAHGKLNIGEAMSPPLIRAVCGRIDDASNVVLDAPPGTSCPVITSLGFADVILLVAEPTAFGLHDLALTVEVVQEMPVPMGVFINRSDMGDDRVERFCRKKGIPVWGELPENRKLAETYSEGRLVAEVIPEVREQFELLADRIIREVSN